MFCPNCGTQNPEAAQACSKCNFNFKGAGTPKFKGTMLMMNQGGSAPTPPPPPAAAAPPGPLPPPPFTTPGVAPAPQNPNVSKLRGTMVGVAPPMPSVVGKPRTPSAPPTPPNFAAPTTANLGPHAPPPPGYQPAQNTAPDLPVPPGYGAPPPPAQQGYSPQQTQVSAGQAVNPLGGTMAADSFNPFASAPPGGYGAYAPQPQQPAYGAPPPPDLYAPPPVGPAGYGGGPPGGVPPGYSPAGGLGDTIPQQGFGGNTMPQQPMYGGAAMQPYQGGAGGSIDLAIAPQALQGAPSSGGPRPTTRNAVMTMAIPAGCVLGGMIVSVVFSIVAGIAGSAILGMLGGLVALVACLAGAVLGIIAIKKMVGEVTGITRNPSFAWWMVLIPIYGLVVLLPPEVANAKRIVGSTEPVRSPVLYFFVGLYALASDLNDIAARVR